MAADPFSSILIGLAAQASGNTIKGGITELRHSSSNLLKKIFIQVAFVFIQIFDTIRIDIGDNDRISSRGKKKLIKHLREYKQNGGKIPNLDDDEELALVVAVFKNTKPEILTQVAFLTLAVYIPAVAILAPWYVVKGGLKGFGKWIGLIDD